MERTATNCLIDNMSSPRQEGLESVRLQWNPAYWDSGCVRFGEEKGGDEKWGADVVNSCSPGERS